MNISFAWTSLALVTGNKTVTRRDYDDQYRSRFTRGRVLTAWDRLPKHGGKKIALIELTESAKLLPLAEMPDSDYESEGFAFYDSFITEANIAIIEGRELAESVVKVANMVGRSFQLPPGMDMRWNFDMWKRHGDDMTVIRFKLLSLFPEGERMAERFGLEPWRG